MAGDPTVALDRTRHGPARRSAAGDPPAEPGGLANVAGVPGTFPAELVLRVNVLGLRHLTEALLPRLGPGSMVVNVASVAAGRDPAPREVVAGLLATPSFEADAAWVNGVDLRVDGGLVGARLALPTAQEASAP